MTLEEIPYIERVDESDQKSVTFSVENPEHPEIFIERHEDEEMLKNFFEGAEWSVDTLSKDRNKLVGHFLYAVMMAEEEENYQELLQLFRFILPDDHPMYEGLVSLQKENYS